MFNETLKIYRDLLAAKRERRMIEGRLTIYRDQLELMSDAEVLEVYHKHLADVYSKDATEYVMRRVEQIQEDKLVMEGPAMLQA